jgi:hypothetical protein
VFEIKKWARKQHKRKFPHQKTTKSLMISLLETKQERYRQVAMNQANQVKCLSLEKSK